MIQTKLKVVSCVNDLPSASEGKQGWPWTEASNKKIELPLFAADWPKVSVIIPNFNGGQFLEESIRSVLLQCYPNLELIIIDGGSSDNSIEIIKKYEDYISYWISESDRGQSHALNKGIKIATGEWIGWQNSDDYYCPNALFSLITNAIDRKVTGFCYGCSLIVNDAGEVLENKSDSFSFANMIPYPCIFNQSTIINAAIFKKIGVIDESLKFTMDHELFWRIPLSGFTHHKVDQVCGAFRRRKGAKTFGVGKEYYIELFNLYKVFYLNPPNEPNVCQKLSESMIGCCLNLFGMLELSQFRKLTLEYFQICGLSLSSFRLLPRYACSFGGQYLVGRVKKVKRLISCN